MWYKKLDSFFSERKITNKKLASIMGYSEQMIGRYLKGNANINAEFIGLLIKNFPDINLQDLFREDYPENESELLVTQDPPGIYMNVDFELQKMEAKIKEIRLFIASQNAV